VRVKRFKNEKSKIRGRANGLFEKVCFFGGDVLRLKKILVTL
jgi:hypothetical protein